MTTKTKKNKPDLHDGAKCLYDIQEFIRSCYNFLVDELETDTEEARKVIREAVEDGFLTKKQLLEKAETEMNKVYHEVLTDIIEILQEEVKKYEDRN